MFYLQRDQIFRTARNLVNQAQSQAQLSPHWKWPGANLRLSNELLALASQEHPSLEAIDDLSARYENELKRCHGVASFDFLRCLESLPNPGAQMPPRAFTRNRAMEEYRYLPRWQQLAMPLLIMGGIAFGFGTMVFRPPISRDHLTMIFVGVFVIPFVIVNFIAFITAIRVYQRRVAGKCIRCGRRLDTMRSVRCSDCSKKQ